MPDENADEFESLFPEWDEVKPRPRGLTDWRSWRLHTNKARELLARLRGWLDGCIAEAQIQANAQAYAEKKLKKERGVGFRPPE